MHGTKNDAEAANISAPAPEPCSEPVLSASRRKFIEGLSKGALGLPLVILALKAASRSAQAGS